MDYVPLLPWLGFIGRHTLIVYILHQPIILGVLYAADYLMNMGK